MFAPVSLEDAGAGIVVTTPIEWRFPHSGPPTGPDCGLRDWWGHESSPGKLHAWLTPHDCGQRYCSTCRSIQKEDGSWLIRGWERREGHAIRDRWQEYLQGALATRAAIHVVVSPPQDRAIVQQSTVEGYRALRAEAVAVARFVGIDTACQIYHHARLGVEAGAEWGCREGPHFHLICTARAKGSDAWIDGQKVAESYEAWGWIVRSLGVRLSIYATAAYLLSHAGLSCLCGDPSPWERTPPIHTVTWWGYGMDWPRAVDEGAPGEWCSICDAEIPADKIRRVIWSTTEPPEPPPPGTAIEVYGDGWALEKTPAEVWREWRLGCDRFRITEGAEGDLHPGKPPFSKE